MERHTSTDTFSLDSQPPSSPGSKSEVNGEDPWAHIQRKKTEEEESFIHKDQEQAVEVAHAKWYRGWGTHVLMVFFYLFALAVAVGHILFFRYMDGRTASNNELEAESTLCFHTHCATMPYTSQEWITTSSVILTNVVELALKFAVTVAFTQILWRILRTATLRVGTIEDLFNIRTNPLKLFSWTVMKSAWSLLLIAIFLYCVPFGCSFPPGALTVKSISPDKIGLAFVPTYNVSDPGNQTVGGMVGVSLATLSSVKNEAMADEGQWSVMVQPDFSDVSGSLQRLAAMTNLAGEPQTIPSSCGPNCTYTYQFQAPTFECTETTVDSTMAGLDDLSSSGKNPLHTIWSSSWYYFSDTTDLSDNAQPILLNISVVNIPQTPYQSSTLLTSEASINTTTTNLACIPYRALYTVTNTYVNSNQTLNYTVAKQDQIPHLEDPVQITGMAGGNSSSLGEFGNINWDDSIRQWWRDCQMMGIVNGMATALNGTISTLQQTTGNLTTTPEVTVYWSSISLTSNGYGGPLIPFSRFSNSFHSYGFPMQEMVDPAINFTINEESLNKALGDYVVSIIPSFGAWNQSQNVTLFPSKNIYTFSSPKNIIIPYSILLALALPIILLGIHALHHNGVPATDGGFIQVLNTTTGSNVLRKAAAANCLGGDGNTSDQLMRLKIKYGELVNLRVEHNGIVVRRAGFGVEGEVVPLEKGEKYGVVHVGDV